MGAAKGGGETGRGRSNYGQAGRWKGDGDDDNDDDGDDGDDDDNDDDDYVEKVMMWEGWGGGGTMVENLITVKSLAVVKLDL